jgi:formylglycine-generating enzyme required for sulfatase activity
MRRLIVTIFLISLCLLISAENFLYQGFEDSATDNWNFSANPLPNRLIYWGHVNTTIGSASAYEGDWYWAGWDLDNTASSLTFNNVPLAMGYSYALSFCYFTAGLNPATEYSRYAISLDNGESWQSWVQLLPNSNAWTRVEVDIPAYAGQLMLKVEAKQDGIAKFSHWDSFLLERSPVEPTEPVVYELSAAQRMDGSGVVDISYSLFDANNDLCMVSIAMAVGIDAAYNYSPDPANLSGDIGANIAPGTDKQIVWNAGAEGISFDGSQYRLKVIADDGTIRQVATPVIAPPGGTFSSSVTVTITCATANAEIRYTLDGSDPSETSELYTVPIEIDGWITLKAKGYRQDWQPSARAEAIFEGFTPANFVYVPGGTFNNGTSDVTVSSFYMDKYELTQAGYQSVMGSNPASGYGEGANYPVYYVSWFNAIEYSNRRSMQEGLSPCYNYSTYGTNPDTWPTGWNSDYNNHTNVSCNWTVNGYRLPTEAEWQYAARGGNQTHNYTYSGSNDINAVAWYDSNSGNTTHTVGTKTANELGLFDMSGNVWEWSWDIYGSYSSGSQTNPHGATSGSGRVRRGGSWSNVAGYCTVSYRHNADATYSFSYIGLRLVRFSP